MSEHKTMKDAYFHHYIKSRNRMQKAYELWKIMLDDNHPEADSFYEEYEMAKASFEKAKNQLDKISPDL